MTVFTFNHLKINVLKKRKSDFKLPPSGPLLKTGGGRRVVIGDWD